MTFNINNFKEVGGAGNSQDGGQFYSLFSDTDTLGTMMVSGYASALSGKFNTGDSVVLSGSDGSQVVQITDTAGVITFSSSDNTGIASTLSGAGVVPITARSADVTSTGTDTMTVADGAVGQLLNITHVGDGGAAVITPANGLGYTTVTMADVGDSVQLEMKSAGWAVVGQGGLGTGPVVA